MNKLTILDCKELLGDYDYSFDRPVYLYVPSTKFEQPIIMYHFKKYRNTKHYLSNEVKLKFEPGMHIYEPDNKGGV